MATLDRIEQHSLSWADLSRLLRKHRLSILVVFLTVVLGCWVTLQIAFTEDYETQAAVVVKLGRENAEVPTTVQNGQLLSQGVRIADINTEVQMLSSRAHVEAVVDQFGADAFKNVLAQPQSWLGYPKYYLKLTARWVKAQYKEFLIAVNLKKRLSPREEAILFVAKGLKVEPIKESDVLTIKLRMPDPKLAVDVANAILVHYLAQRIEVRRTNAGTAFFANELKAHQKSLSDLEYQRAAVRNKYELSSPVEQRTNLLKQLSELQTRVAAIDAEIARFTQEREVIGKDLKTLPEMLQKERVTAQNPSILSLKERITNLRLERAKLLNRYQEDSEVVLKVDREISGLEGMLNRESPTILATSTLEANPVEKELAKQLVERNFQIAGLQQHRAKLLEPIAQIERQLSQMNTGTDAFDRADREFRIAEQYYMLYVKKHREAKLGDVLDQQHVANVSIVAPPELPIEPVYPPKMFVMSIALPVGLLLGIVFAALRESMEDRITAARDLESVPGITLFGTYRMPEPAALPVGAIGQSSLRERS